MEERPRVEGRPRAEERARAEERPPEEDCSAPEGGPGVEVEAADLDLLAGPELGPGEAGRARGEAPRRRPVQRDLIYAPEAADDLARLRDYIAARSGTQRALGYVDRIMAACDGLTTFPERGRTRDDLRPGLRIVGFERRVAIAFHVTDTMVVIDRILYGGRDLGDAFAPD